MIKVMPDYVISTTLQQALSFCDGGNALIIGFIRYNWGNQNKDCKQWNMLK